MTIVYDASELNEISVLMRWRGTIMAMVLTRPVIWILVGIHYFFLHLHLEREDIELPMLPWSIVGVPTSLLTFFLVFYSGNCFARYYALYGKCMSMNGAVMSWVGLCRIFFNSASSETLWNLSRHMLASVYVQYFTLGGDASDGGKLITESEWAIIMRHRMLSEQARDPKPTRPAPYTLHPRPDPDPGPDHDRRRRGSSSPRTPYTLHPTPYTHSLHTTPYNLQERQQLAAYTGFKPFLLQCWALQTVAECHPNLNPHPAPTLALPLPLPLALPLALPLNRWPSTLPPTPSARAARASALSRRRPSRYGRTAVMSSTRWRSPCPSPTSTW